jgi:hypothetical protein
LCRGRRAAGIAGGTKLRGWSCARRLRLHDGRRLRRRRSCWRSGGCGRNRGRSS